MGRKLFLGQKRMGLFIIFIIVIAFFIWSINQSNMRVLSAGTWGAIGGNAPLAPATVGEIYSYGWYVMRFESDNTMSITWDTGMGCATTRGLIISNRIMGIEQGTIATFTIDESGNTATAIFLDGGKVHTKQLQKINTNTTSACI
jgi:hypothetical protein